MSGQQESILLVEDEKNLGPTLQEYLEGKGHQCLLAKNAQSAKELFKKIRPSIVLLDIGLPDGSGLDLAKDWRSQRKDFVLLFLSAQNDPDTKLMGLEIGAEDYITKPFALKELTLRLERILENQKTLSKRPEVIEHGPLKIWFSRYEVQDAQGEIWSLTQKECAILELLYQNKGQVIQRDHIISVVWGEEAFPSTRTVDNYIVKLRKWCESDPQKNIQIQSVRGAGYKLIDKEAHH